jgi:hypothetical protein
MIAARAVALGFIHPLIFCGVLPMAAQHAQEYRAAARLREQPGSRCWPKAAAASSTCPGILNFLGRDSSVVYGYLRGQPSGSGAGWQPRTELHYAFSVVPPNT